MKTNASKRSLGGPMARALIVGCVLLGFALLRWADAASAEAPSRSEKLLGTIIKGQAVGPLGPILQWAGGDLGAVGTSLTAPFIVGGYKSGALRQLASAGLGLTIEWLPVAKEVRVWRAKPTRDFIAVDCATSYVLVNRHFVSVEEAANIDPNDFDEMFVSTVSNRSEAGYDDASEVYGEICEAANSRALNLLRAPEVVKNQLTRLRIALAAWEEAQFEMQSLIAGGGTMYVHLAIRSRTSREQLMTRLVGMALGGDGVPTATVGDDSDLDLGVRVSKLVARLDQNSAAIEKLHYSTDPGWFPKYKAEVTDSLVRATAELAGAMGDVPPDWARIVARYATGDLDMMDWS